MAAISSTSRFTAAGIRALRDRFPDVPILALTVYDNNEQVFAALCAGSPMSPEVVRRVIDLFRKFTPREPADYHLTAQETELLKLLVEGHHYKTAAQQLGVSVNTISFHLKNIYVKLRVHSKTEAVAKALREDLT